MEYTRYGGVYAPVTQTTPPNPYLVNVPERDLITPSGWQLTLLKHAYMIRKVYEMDQNGPEGNLVASQPLNPENLPNAWERKALESFAAGKNESFAVMDARPAPVPADTPTRAPAGLRPLPRGSRV